MCTLSTSKNGKCCAISNSKYRNYIAIRLFNIHMAKLTSQLLHENIFLCSSSELESDPRSVEKHLINGSVLCVVPALQSRCTRIQVVYTQCEDIHCEGPFRISI